MSERLLKCPLCKSGNILNNLLVKDHAVSKKEFTLCRCGDCELQFTNPRPKEEEIGPYYDFKEYYSHEDTVQNFTRKRRSAPTTILKNTTHTKIPFRILRSGSIKKSESPASEERLD